MTRETDDLGDLAVRPHRHGRNDPKNRPSQREACSQRVPAMPRGSAAERAITRPSTIQKV
jgi:hypothetical protein